MNSVFLPTHVMAEIDTRRAALAPNDEHIQRWQTVERSLAKWFAEVQALREFANTPAGLAPTACGLFLPGGTYTAG